jgi:hypothetical protein
MTNHTTEDTATNLNDGARVCIENGLRDLLFVSVTSVVELL